MEHTDKANEFYTHDDANYILEVTKQTIKQFNKRPTWDQYFVIQSYWASSRSSCHRLNVGCVIVNNNRVISTGYNGHIPNSPHDSVVRDGHEQMTIHAESNAVADAAKRGVSLQNSTAYVTHSPCIICAKLLIASGIKEIIFSEKYKFDELTIKMYKSANVKVYHYDDAKRNEIC